MKNIAIYGAGGLGREVACLLNRINSLTKPTWHLTGFFDDAQQPGTSNEYGPILGNINTLNAHPSPPAIIIAIGSPAIVAKIHSQITNPLIDYPNIIAPEAIPYLNNKHLFNAHFSKYVQRRWLYSADMSFEEFRNLCAHSRSIIVKPEDGVEGYGVRKYTPPQRVTRFAEAV